MKSLDNKQKNKSLFFLVIFLLLTGILFYFFPEKLIPTLKSSWTSLSQFLMIFPAIILLMGIFSVAVTPEVIEKNFGKETGFIGALKALLFGSFMSTGPFYLSFPMAKNLIEKGAKVSDVIIFVSAWNGVGIIAEIVELHFMGVLFMSIRFSLNIILILVCGYVAQFIMNLGKKNL